MYKRIQVWACATNFKRPFKDPATYFDRTYAMMLGNCYAYSNDRNSPPRRIIPLDDPNTQDSYWKHMNGRNAWKDDTNQYRFGNVFAELGSTLHYDSISDRIIYGAPGAWNWTGTAIMYVYSTSRNTLDNEIYFSNYQCLLNFTIFFSTDVRGYNPTRAQPVGKNEPKMYDYSGYAITSGINRKRIMMMMYN